MKYCTAHKAVPFFIFLFISVSAVAQTNSIQLLNTYQALPASLTPYLKQGQIAVFDKTEAGKILITKPTTLNFSFRFENKEWVIELTRNELFSKAFAVTTGSNLADKFNYNKEQALHYRGSIKGSPHSFAAVTVLADKLVAVIADEKGNINIGAINTAAAVLSSTHIIYREADLLIEKKFDCSTADAPPVFANPVPVYTPAAVTGATVNEEPVDIYFEADYTTYLNNGSDVNNVVNYVTALFNVVHTLYENDSISTRVSGIKVWNTQDPYISLTTTATVLNAFSANMTNGFPGDIAHFLCQRALGGGRAYLDILCSSNSLKTGVSGNMTNSFNLFPLYSWSTMVVTHETGHNLGSPHTQNCGWPGGAIDNCYPTEGGCAPGPAPVGGGTMMSYCHLTSYGINFTKGFGPLPGYLIRSRVRNSTCINPLVNFETTSQTVSEENATIENGCFDYSLVTAKIKINYTPSQPATVTLLPTIPDGLEIGPGKDLEVSPMSFTLDSTNLSQIISFKVYNDALIEGTESLLLNFNLDANGGNAVKRNTNNSYTINITETDHTPYATPDQLLYRESFDSISNGLGNWEQTVVYGVTLPNRWIVGYSADPFFAGKSAYISNDGGTYAYSGYTAGDSSIVRLASPAINASGFSGMHLTYLYKCVGEYSFVQGGGTGQGENMIGKDYGKLLYSVNNGSDWVLLKDNISGRYSSQPEDIALPAAANNSSTLRIAFEWINNDSVVNNPPLLIDDIEIKGVSTSAIQSAADTANNNEVYLGPFQTAHYYNPVTNNIMATIENTSSFDFGCTQVELIRTGTGAAAAWDTAAASKISEKAYRITAGNNNAAAPYNLTLYYTSDEINGWAAATGNAATEPRIVKTSGDILAPASAAAFSSVNNISNYGATSHKAISASFTGFSTFAITKPFSSRQCPAANITCVSGIPGTTYQWQVNTGSGYTNIADNVFYSGTAADTLLLSSPPTAYYGYRYRCVVNTAYGTVYSPEFTLTFGMKWLGTQSKVWENPLNWGCATLPDANTDVIIGGGTTFTPEVSSNTTIRSLKASPAANVTVKTSAALIIKN